MCIYANDFVRCTMSSKVIVLDFSKMRQKKKGYEELLMYWEAYFHHIR